MMLARNKLILIALAPVFGGVLVALDQIADPGIGGAGELALDLFEKSVLAGAMIGIALLVVRVESMAANADTLRADLDHARREGAEWRAKGRILMESLSEAIKAQFDLWDLTPAESDIAGLMLKGLSLKEIATLRQTSEATIRQQAQGVYRKSGLSNRAQLSAYFLEDLYDVAHAGGAESERRTVN